MDPASYVTGLRDNLKHIHDNISLQLRADLAVRQSRAEKEAKPGHIFNVGDKVFLKRPPAALQPSARSTTSKRLLSRADTQLYEIAKVISPQTVVLRHPDTKSTQLGFGQPVSTARLIPYDLPFLESPIDAHQPLRLEVLCQGSWKAGRIVAQSATGAVRIVYDDEPTSEHMINLECEEYRWIY